MKYKFIIAIVFTATLGIPSMAQKKKAAKPVEVAMANREDSISYSIGVLFGNNLKQFGVDKINAALLAKGIDEVLAKKPTLLDEAKANELVGKFMAEQRKIKTEKKLQENNAFLEKNKALPGVVTLPSGLQYKILKEGNGEKPLAESKVTVHYHGTLVDGKVFDSSVERGEPIQLPVNGVIEGWKEALQLMPVGSKWQLVVPSNLGYGENPAGQIEPNSVLIFEVELISIDKEAEQPATEEQVTPVQVAPETKQKQ